MTKNLVHCKIILQLFRFQNDTCRVYIMSVRSSEDLPPQNVNTVTNHIYRTY